MPDGAWIALALAATVLGLAWLALALDTHRQQVIDAVTARNTAGARAASARPGDPAPQRVARALRLAGTFALAAAFGCLLAAGHASMAVLVWTMALAFGAALVACVLAWRPRLLAPLLLPFEAVLR